MIVRRFNPVAFRRTLALSAAAAALLVAGAGAAQELSLKRVVLSSGGLGLYEYEAEVSGDAKVKLTVGFDQVDDVLKSLVVYDDKGGVGGLDLPSREPLTDAFRSLPFGANDLASEQSLLEALRGAEIEVEGARSLKGRVVGVVEETQSSTDGKILSKRHRVTLSGEGGLKHFILEETDGVKFSDPSLQSHIDHALAALASTHEKDTRTLELVSKGKERRKVRVAYIVQAPLWKASYRLVLSSALDAKQGALQGWATLENLSGQDWRGVDLTLVSGEPVTFHQALYRAYLVDRPEAPVEVVGRLLPTIDQGGVGQDANEGAFAQKDNSVSRRRVMRPAVPAAPMVNALGLAEPASRQKATKESGLADEDRPASEFTPEQALANSSAAITAQEGLTQVLFHVADPISVDKGRTLSLPIIDGEAPVERISFHQPNVSPRHPLSAVRLTNVAKTGLPPGIVTIYEQGAGGLTFAGDSRLSALPPGENRLLSFALDQKVTIERNENTEDALTRATLSKGVLRTENLQRRTIVFKVKSPEKRRIVVEAPKLPGWTLKSPSSAGVLDAEGRYRIPFDAEAGDGQTFKVTLEHVDVKEVVVSGADDDRLGFYFRAREIDSKTHEQLGKLIDLRAKVGAAEKVVEQIKSQSDEAVQDEERIRQNLGAVPVGSDLHKRYLLRLDQRETELDGLKAQRKGAEKAQMEAAAVLENYISNL